MTDSWLISTLIGRCTPSHASIGSIHTPPASTRRRPWTTPFSVRSDSAPLRLEPVATGLLAQRHASLDQSTPVGETGQVGVGEAVDPQRPATRRRRDSPGSILGARSPDTSSIGAPASRRLPARYVRSSASVR